MQNLVRAVRSVVRHHGASPALLDHSGSVFTWRQFEDRIARAAGLLAAIGVPRGGRYAVLSRNGHRNETLRWGGFWRGAICVPVNFRLAPPEIAQILEDAQCGALFIEAPFLPMLEHPALAPWKAKAVPIGEASGEGDSALEARLREAQPVAPHDAAAEDEALLLYTGGTTGRSKGVRLSHANILSNAWAFGLGTGARGDQVYLRAAPMFHSADLLCMGWFLQGAPQAFLPQFSPAAFLEAIGRHRVGAVVTVPTMLMGVVSDQASLQKADLSSLRVLVYGAAPMALDWIRRVAKAFPDAGLFNCYGLTETSPDLTIFEARAFRKALESGAPHATSVGKANAANELKVVRPDGTECAPGEPGELLARGPNIMLGYHNRPKETAAALRDGWLHTGDVAIIDEGGYVHLLDRLKDLVITGGENVYSSEVEAVLHQHPDVAEAAVIGVPDERLGETVLAVLVPRPGRSPDPAEVAAFCRGSLGGFKVPRRFQMVDALPKSALGKVLKSELRKTISAQAKQEKA